MNIKELRVKQVSLEEHRKIKIEAAKRDMSIKDLVLKAIDHVIKNDIELKEL